MKIKNIHIYIIISIGFLIIILYTSLHLLDSINYLFSLILKYEPDFKHRFFGIRFSNFNFFEDIIMVIIIFLICLLIFLTIYWSEKNGNSK